MHIADLPKPVAVFKCGELDESYPEAHKAFVEEFLCTIEFVDFVVDADEALWAFVGDGEAYTWRDESWVDASLFI
jgi:hypothetical protein